MSGIGKVASYVLRNTAKLGINAHVVTKRVAGFPVKKNLLTGTEFLKLADGTKSITLGKGSRLSKILGEGTSICSYPKGSMLNNSERLIAVKGKNANGVLAFNPKEFGDFVKMLNDLNKLNKI